MDALTMVVTAVVVLFVASAAYYVLRGRGHHPKLEALLNGSQRRYAEEWRVIETMFIDHPKEAVAAADALCVEILHMRGAEPDDSKRVPHSLRQARRQARSWGGDARRRAMQRYQRIVDDACGRDTREAAEQARLEIA